MENGRRSRLLHFTCEETQLLADHFAEQWTIARSALDITAQYVFKSPKPIDKQLAWQVNGGNGPRSTTALIKP